MIRPTGYTLDIEADVLWVIMRQYGKSCPADRKENFKHDDGLDSRASAVWSKLNARLQQDGFPKWTWTGEDTP